MAVRYTAFWPLVIFFVGVLVWAGFQLYQIGVERSAVHRQYDEMARAVGPAQSAEERWGAFVNDLAATSRKDQLAAQVVREALAAGLLRAQAPSTNAPSAGQ